MYDPEGKLPHPDLDESFRFSLEDGDLDTKIQEIKYDSNDSSCSAYWRPVRGLGTSDTAFENVWKDWLNDKIII